MAKLHAVINDNIPETEGFLLDAVLKHRSAEELFIVAHIKRFAECFTGDEEFRQVLLENPENCDNIAKLRGCLISPEQIRPLWERAIRRKISAEELAEYPYLRIWTNWLKDMIALRNAVKKMGRTYNVNSRFDAWRLRQIARCEHELGDSEGTVVHSILAFELSKGCSVGCWFCGLSAIPFAEVFTGSEENMNLWHEILKVCVHTFGTAVQIANCYWATEPFDNPDYLKFSESYYHICGGLPQTTTATPLKSIPMTMEMLKLRKKYPTVPDRFSILSTDVLRKIHTMFSPEDLLGVEMIMQHKGAGEGAVSKALTGRFREKHIRDRKFDENQDIPLGLGTISCTSGFVVNMVDRSIRLVSPCRASERWPLGYRLHTEGVFHNAAEFRTFIEWAINEHMNESVANNQVLGFHPGLQYIEAENGFSLHSPFRKYNFAGGAQVASLGKMICRGDLTTQVIVRELLEEGANIFFVLGTINDLFRRGLLRDHIEKIC